MSDLLDDEPRKPDDRYPRSRDARDLGTAALQALYGVGAVDAEKHDEAWWAARDAEVQQVKAQTVARERDEARRKRAEMLKSHECCFPAIAVDGALATWPETTASRAHAERFATSARRVLILAGGVGAGKSTAAAWLALEAGGSAPAFVRASELEARGRYDEDLRTWLRTRSLLVIDDLGAEVLDGKGVFRSLLDEVIDMFYGDRKRVVITTNLRARRASETEELQLAERYGERMMSRLVEVGLWGDCGVRDLRREGARGAK